MISINHPSEKIQAVVLGTGTSSGIPVIACNCPICTSENPKNRRLRSSVLLRNGNRSIIIDCGIDFREQALAHRIDRVDAILLTHSHSDHISGLDEIRIYNWLHKKTVPLYGNSIALEALRSRYDYLFTPLQLGGGISQVELHAAPDEPFEVDGLLVEPLPVMHGRLPILGYRFGEFAYVTDASEVSRETIAKLRGVRYLILNALRHKPHPTHLNVEQAVALAQEIGPEKAWFTHIAHDLEHEATNAMLPAGMALGHDGLTFEFLATTVSRPAAE